MADKLRLENTEQKLEEAKAQYEALAQELATPKGKMRNIMSKNAMSNELKDIEIYIKRLEELKAKIVSPEIAEQKRQEMREKREREKAERDRRRKERLERERLEEEKREKERLEKEEALRLEQERSEKAEEDSRTAQERSEKSAEYNKELNRIQAAMEKRYVANFGEIDHEVPPEAFDETKEDALKEGIQFPLFFTKRRVDDIEEEKSFDIYQFGAPEPILDLEIERFKEELGDEADVEVSDSTPVAPRPTEYKPEGFAVVRSRSSQSEGFASVQPVVENVMVPDSQELSEESLEDLAGAALAELLFEAEEIEEAAEEAFEEEIIEEEITEEEIAEEEIAEEEIAEEEVAEEEVAEEEVAEEEVVEEEVAEEEVAEEEIDIEEIVKEIPISDFMRKFNEANGIAGQNDAEIIEETVTDFETDEILEEVLIEESGVEVEEEPEIMVETEDVVEVETAIEPEVVKETQETEIEEVEDIKEKAVKEEPTMATNVTAIASVSVNSFINTGDTSAMIPIDIDGREDLYSFTKISLDQAELFVKHGNLFHAAIAAQEAMITYIFERYVPQSQVEFLIKYMQTKIEVDGDNLNASDPYRAVIYSHIFRSEIIAYFTLKRIQKYDIDTINSNFQTVVDMHEYYRFIKDYIAHIANRFTYTPIKVETQEDNQTQGLSLLNGNNGAALMAAIKDKISYLIDIIKKDIDSTEGLGTIKQMYQTFIFESINIAEVEGTLENSIENLFILLKRSLEQEDSGYVDESLLKRYCIMCGLREDAVNRYCNQYDINIHAVCDMFEGFLKMQSLCYQFRNPALLSETLISDFLISNPIVRKLLDQKINYDIRQKESAITLGDQVEEPKKEKVKGRGFFFFLKKKEKVEEPKQNIINGIDIDFYKSAFLREGFGNINGVMRLFNFLKGKERSVHEALEIASQTKRSKKH